MSSCPWCGHTAAAAQTKTADAVSAGPAAGREWKIVRLIGVLLMLAGVVACTGGSGDAGMVFVLGCVFDLGGWLGARWMQRT